MTSTGIISVEVPKPVIVPTAGKITAPFLNSKGSAKWGPAMKGILTPLKISDSKLCDEDYTKHAITELSEHYQDYFNEEFGEGHWYYCVLNEEVMDRMQCASGWSAVGPQIYAYGCQQIFETESDISFPDASSACYTGYSMDADAFTEEDPLDGSFFVQYECSKDGSRSSEAPCIGNHLTTLHNALEAICYK